MIVSRARLRRNMAGSFLSPGRRPRELSRGMNLCGTRIREAMRDTPGLGAATMAPLSGTQHKSGNKERGLIPVKYGICGGQARSAWNRGPVTASGRGWPIQRPPRAIGSAQDGYPRS